MSHPADWFFFSHGIPCESGGNCHRWGGVSPRVIEHDFVADAYPGASEGQRMDVNSPPIAGWLREVELAHERRITGPTAKEVPVRNGAEETC